MIPLLTIGIPIYNGAKTIRTLLDILLPQIDDRVELIVSDNCSTDNTIEIIEEYKNKNPQIKIYKGESNIGADGNFLCCMRLATGKFTMLVSDDDVIIENNLAKVLSFLEKHPNVQLAYLHTVGFRDSYNPKNIFEFKEHSRKVNEDVVTTDKREFFSYVDRQWGFTSSFVWNTRRCQSIVDPEQYFNTFWLQSYIHILCSDKKADELGIICGPCIAAGSYGIIGNYDTAEIEAVYYKRMLDFAIKEAGYDQEQLYNEWLWKVCYLASRAIIKEKSIGKSITSKKTLFRELKGFPYAWIKLFPVFILPGWICKMLLSSLRRIQGRQFLSYVNRPTDIES